MAAKHALVVDDSRVALLSLRKMLEEHRLEVDTAESAEDALKYLQQNRPPAVVFMDHMMPGMDGFEALQAIKRDAHTASIPVVMYTSREGEAYMGQAKALGAAAVLSKPIRPIQLGKILEQLNLMTPAGHGDAARAPTDAPRNDLPPAEVRDLARMAVEAVNQSPLANLLRRLFEEQRSAVRQDLAEIIAGTGAPIATANVAPPPAKWRWWRIGAIALLALLPTLWAWDAYRDAERARAQLAAELAQTKQATTAASDVSPDLVASLERAQRKAQQDNAALLETLVWALNGNGEYEFDQPPLNDDRLHTVRELVTRLAQIDFRGTVRLETHVAEFCLVRTEAGTVRMPSDDAPIARCEIVSHTPEQAINLGKRQSIAFARYLASAALANAGVRVEVVSHGKERPLVHYPPISNLQTAGDWNKIARRNNRVEVALIAAP